MKKSLIALAALAATASFAQSSVTLDGYFDRGYTVVNNSANTKDAKGLASSAGTTTFGISGVEDLGGGLKLGFRVNTDWADLGGLTQGAANNSTYTAGSTNANTTLVPSQTGAFANSQSFIDISGAFGTVRAGSINNEVLTAATGVASPAFSTGVGSVYSSSWSIHNGYGTGTTGAAGIVTKTALGADKGGVRGIRQANTIKYISPNFNGFTVALGYAPKNDVGGTTDLVGVTEMSARYRNGPLDVMYASIKYDVGSNAPAQGSLTASSDNTNSILGASYQVLPTLKLHAGYGQSKASANSIANSKSQQVGVTWNATSAIDVMLQTAKVDDKNSTGYDRKMVGLGVDYKFSKTARAYLRYDDLKLNDGGTVTAGDSIKRTAVGISKSF